MNLSNMGIARNDKSFESKKMSSSAVETKDDEHVNFEDDPFQKI